MRAVDRATSPLLAAYVAALPQGLASHPQCQVKGSVFRSLISSAPIELAPSSLPDELAAKLREPPLPSEWSSEVHLNALGLAYQDRMPSDRHDRWVLERNERLLRAPLYRILFALVSPERIFVGFAHRWGAFRRGTELSLVERTGQRAALRLMYPRHLHNDVTLTNVTIAFRAVAQAAGAREASARVVKHDAFEALLEITWR
jgi:hypothetical protein